MKGLLPIGSIVKIDSKSDDLIMIVGYYPYDKSAENEIYTYSGVFYPTGINIDMSINMFHENAIEEIVYKGYCDEECKEFLDDLDDINSFI